MAEIIDTLHPKNNPTDDLYPNVKKENIPSKAISFEKLDDDVRNKIGEALPTTLLNLEEDEEELYISKDGDRISFNELKELFTSNRNVILQYSSIRLQSLIVEQVLIQFASLVNNVVYVVKVNSDESVTLDSINLLSLDDEGKLQVNSYEDLIDGEGHVIGMSADEKNRLAKTIVIPTPAITEQELVGVNPSKEQTRVTIDKSLKLQNNKLSVNYDPTEYTIFENISSRGGEIDVIEANSQIVGKFVIFKVQYLVKLPTSTSGRICTFNYEIKKLFPNPPVGSQYVRYPIIMINIVNRWDGYRYYLRKYQDNELEIYGYIPATSDKTPLSIMGIIPIPD